MPGFGWPTLGACGAALLGHIFTKHCAPVFNAVRSPRYSSVTLTSNAKSTEQVLARRDVPFFYCSSADMLIEVVMGANSLAVPVERSQIYPSV